MYKIVYIARALSVIFLLVCAGLMLLTVFGVDVGLP